MRKPHKNWCPQSTASTLLSTQESILSCWPRQQIFFFLVYLLYCLKLTYVSRCLQSQRQVIPVNFFMSTRRGWSGKALETVSVETDGRDACITTTSSYCELQQAVSSARATTLYLTHCQPTAALSSQQAFLHDIIAFRTS